MNFVQPDVTNNTHTSLSDTLKGICIIGVSFTLSFLFLYKSLQTVFTIFECLAITLAILVVISCLVSWFVKGGVRIK